MIKAKSGLVFDDSHIFRMTDDTGMFQHTRFSVPDLSEGYTADDNARALIMAVMLYERQHKKKFLALVYRYLAFVLHAQNETGRFRNFMTYNRQFTETEGSEDCFGRCLWALGYTLASPAMPAGVKAGCASAVRRALPNIPLLLKWIRGQAYAIIGLGFVAGSEADTMIHGLAAQLADAFEKYTEEADWQWFEDELTYDNAVLPWAMFTAYRRTKQDRLLHAARESMAFFDKVSFRDGFFRPVGCNGWWIRGKEPALYDQQPVEASMSTLAHLAAFAVTGEQGMLELAKKSFAWYSGDNSLGESLIDPDTGGCFDGITPEGVNRNQGAESIVGYGIATLALAKYKSADRGIMKQAKRY
ncbi:MAG: hypothetical protein ABFC84_13695 [Veillonellales bacterium]